jgi:hypothetical protein
MTQSLIMAPFRRVRHTELTPVAPRGREQMLLKAGQSEPPKVHKLNQVDHSSGGPKRAFSMTRLDQLARPRQRYLEEALRLRASVTKDPLVSPTRPTSSMSTANRYGIMPVSGTVPYRPLASARKPRPLSIATPNAPENMMTSSVILPGSSATIERPSRSAFRAKLPFVQPSNDRAQSAGSGRRQSIGAIDGGCKPTPPRKPSQVKAASAARRLVKNSSEVEKPLTKSSSTCKLNTITRTSDRVDKPKTMRKSATNPDAISVAAIGAFPASDSQQVTGDLVDIPERPSSESKSAGEADSEANSMKSKSEVNSMSDAIANAPARKEVSQEEYRKVMAEKRRLAREQAEKELELERDRITKERAAEEERQRQQLEQLREQEEQQRKVEEHSRQLQQEYEDEQRKDAEEQQRLEEEAKARDEQDRKNREKAEKARLELEERLRKDEEERVARKKV